MSVRLMTGAMCHESNAVSASGYGASASDVSVCVVGLSVGESVALYALRVDSDRLDDGLHLAEVVGCSPDSILGEEHVAFAVHVEDVDTGTAVSQEHKVLVDWPALPNLEFSRNVARCRVEIVRHGQLDPLRRYDIGFPD
jgi:hypothetical protein